MNCEGSRTVVLNPPSSLKLPGEILKIEVLQLHLSQLNQNLGVGPEQKNLFLSFWLISNCSQSCETNTFKTQQECLQAAWP